MNTIARGVIGLMAGAAALLGVSQSAHAVSGYEVTLSRSSTDPYDNYDESPFGLNQTIHLWVACGGADTGPHGLGALEVGISTVSDSVGGTAVLYNWSPSSFVSGSGSGSNLFLAIAGHCGDVSYPLLLGSFKLDDNGGARISFVPSTNGQMLVVNCNGGGGNTRFTGMTSTGSCVPATQGFGSGSCAPDPGGSAIGWDTSFGPPSSSGNGVDAEVHTVYTLRDSSAILVGGHFTTVGSSQISSPRIAMFDGTDWTGLGTLTTTSSHRVHAITEFNGDIVVGGSFSTLNNIAKWNPTSESWSALGNAGFAPVKAFLADDDADLLYAAGGGKVAVWDTNAWSSLGTLKLSTGSTGSGDALVEYSGDLILGGAFDSIGTAVVHNIGRWDGSTWSSMGTGTNGWVRALLVDPISDVLYAAGEFDSAGSKPMTVAKWDGSEWTAMGIPCEAKGRIQAMALYPATSYLGEFVIAGDFTMIGGNLSAKHVASWNGTAWNALGGGTGSIQGQTFPTISLTVLDEDLYVGGFFTAVGPGGSIASARLARWTEAVLTGAPSQLPAAPSPITLTVAPNPTSEGTVIAWSAPQRVTAEVRIYDLRGGLVRTLQEPSPAESRRRRAVWDARDESGTLVATGIYFVRVVTPLGSATERVALVR